MGLGKILKKLDPIGSKIAGKSPIGKKLMGSERKAGAGTGRVTKNDLDGDEVPRRGKPIRTGGGLSPTKASGNTGIVPPRTGGPGQKFNVKAPSGLDSLSKPKKKKMRVG